MEIEEKKGKKEEVGVETREREREATTATTKATAAGDALRPLCRSGVFSLSISLSPLGCGLPPSHLFRSRISISASIKRRFLDARHRMAQRRGKTSNARGRHPCSKMALRANRRRREKKNGDDRTEGKTRERERRGLQSFSLPLQSSARTPLAARPPPGTSFSRSSSMPQRGAMSAHIREARQEAE